MEARTLQGFWWTPEKPEDHIAGTFRFDPVEGLYLDLIGSFGELRDALVGRSEAVIHGIVEGKLVTLFENTETGTKISMPGFSSQSFRPQWAVLGAHLSSFDDLSAAEWSFSVSHLDDWVPRSGFRTTLRFGEGSSRRGGDLSYSLPEDVIAPVTPVGEVAITFGAHFRPRGAVSRTGGSGRISVSDLSPRSA